MAIFLPRRALGALPLLAMPGLVPPRAAWAAPTSPVRFRIVREGSQIGTHRVTFTEGGDGALTALTEVDIQVKLAGITVFRFTHRFEEITRNGRLVQATSRQDRNGRLSEMVARAEGDAVVIRATAGAQRLGADALPLSWWDVKRIADRRPLFGNDTGKPLALTWTRAAGPNGVQRWRASGDADSEGTWAADGTWLAWTTKGEDGSVVNYER